ncbi:MAG: hypothetical protein ACJA0H_001082 [Francisellaceae bacterium]|jgi:hypothetical protein
MKNIILSGFILGFTLPATAMIESTNEAVGFHSIPEVNICFKRTTAIDSVEPTENSSGINLVTLSIESEIVDCSIITDKISVISKNNSPKPILVNGSGKIIEYISSIDTEIRKSGKQTITFQKSDLFSGQGLMFNALNSKCSDVVIDLMQLKRLSVEKDFIQLPELNSQEKFVSCSK